MKLIYTILGYPLGWLIYLCFLLVRNYGLAILLFTLLTRILMFPLSLMSQKNALIMARIQPSLEEIRQSHFGEPGRMVREQKALFKKEGYSSLKSLLPLLVQIPLLLGLVHVIYNPLSYLLRLDQAAILPFMERAADFLSTSPEGLGSSGQLKVLELVQARPDLFSGLEGLSDLLALDSNFLGLSLVETPVFWTPSLIWPLLSGLSALGLALYQNKCYILQQGQGPWRKGIMAAFLTAFSFFFAAVLPGGVGLYWTAGNLLSIGVLALSNRIYDPAPYVANMRRRIKPPLSREERVRARTLKRAMRRKQKEDRRRFYRQADKDLVFYAEARGFYKYFFGFVDYILDHSDLVIHYVTSDFDDPVFHKDHPRFKAYYIGPRALIQFMMRMDARMLVMTTPDLESFHIKRSLVRKDIEYVFVDHGMTSFTLMYRRGALDHFDTIFCYGLNHMEEVRALEALYGLPKKKLVRSGFPLLDSMLEAVGDLGDRKNDPPIILIAPSWQKDNILDLCLDEVLPPLLAEGYRVIVRPHPEYTKRFPGKIQAIRDRYSDLPDDLYELQTDFSSNETVYTADLVITDWSSIAQEFSYATKKPSLFINTPMKILNPEYNLLPLVPLDISQRDQLGVSLDLEDLDRLPEKVGELLARRDLYRDRIEKTLKAHIFDIGDGARSGSEYIIRTLKEKKNLTDQKKGDDPPSKPDPESELRSLACRLREGGPGLQAFLDRDPEDLARLAGALESLLKEKEGEA